jgi:hypothetical protein
MAARPGGQADFRRGGLVTQLAGSPAATSMSTSAIVALAARGRRRRARGLLVVLAAS